MATPRVGLVLGGGGARSAYQVGVLKAVAEMVPEGSGSPFTVVCGSSAGSINAVVVAAYTQNFHEGIRRLIGVWENFEVEKVFRADPWSAISHGTRFVFGMMSGGLGRVSPRSILNNSPLRGLLERHVPFDRVQQAIDQGALRALCLTACSYTTGRSVSFFQATEGTESWTRARRLGRPAPLHIDHLMASTAIPIVFPAVKIGDEYFGDGSMRQTAPISPALHLGADKVMVIGVRQETDLPRSGAGALAYPGLGQIAGYVLDTLFLNSLQADIERLERINQTLGLIPTAQRTAATHLRQIDTLVISPSLDIAAVAEPHQDHLPTTVRYLLRVLGAHRDSGRRLTSYLLFVESFCRELIKLGYADTMQRRQEIIEFLNVSGS